MSTYIVRTASAKMPASTKGRYSRVAVLEVEDGADPKMISERAKGVIRIVRTWERLNHGTSERCAYHRALDEANRMARELSQTATA